MQPLCRNKNSGGVLKSFESSTIKYRKYIKCFHIITKCNFNIYRLVLVVHGGGCGICIEIIRFFPSVSSNFTGFSNSLVSSQSVSVVSNQKRHHPYSPEIQNLRFSTVFQAIQNSLIYIYSSPVILL